MIFAPPGSAKSTYASVLFPAWYLGKNPTKRIISASHTSTLAYTFGRRVRNLILSDEFQQIFDVQLAEDSQAASDWGLNEGGGYRAFGVGAAVTGSRGDLIIVDDPVSGHEAADSKLQRDKTRSWWLNDLCTRQQLDGSTRIVVIMTRWHEDDLAGWLLEQERRGGEKWEVIRLPMLAEENDILGRKFGERLWPEFTSEEKIVQEQRNPRTWTALYQQRPVPDGGGEFKREWIQHYDEQPTIESTNNYIIVDPAGDPNGKSKDQDFTAMIVLGAGRDGNIYIREIIRDRLHLKERVDVLFTLVAKYNPKIVAYERYGMQSDIGAIKMEQEHRNYRFAITEVSTPLDGTRSKVTRIRRLVPYFHDKKIYFPRLMHYTRRNGEMVELIREFVEEEYAPFPVASHDDMLDALSRICDITITYPSRGGVDYKALYKR